MSRQHAATSRAVSVFDISLIHHQVGEPQSQTIDENGTVVGALSLQHADQIKRFFDGCPGAAAPLLVLRDSL